MNRTRRLRIPSVWLLAPLSLALACAAAVPVSEQGEPEPATAPARAGSVPGEGAWPAGSQAGASPAAATPAPPVPQPQEKQSWAQLMKAGREDLELGRLPDAEDRFSRAYDLTSAFRPSDPRTLATLGNLERLANAYRTAGDGDGFARVMDLLIYASETNPAARTARLAALMQQLGGVRSLQGQPEEARDALERAIALLEETRGAGDGSLVGAHAQLGLVLLDLDDLDGAEREIDRAAEIATAVEGSDGPLFARSLVPRARLQLARGDWNAARRSLASAVEIQVTRFGERSPAVARVVREQALLAQQAGDYDAAEQSFERVIAIWDALPDEDYQRAQSRNELAWFQVEAGHAERAEANARSALDILQANAIDGPALASASDTLATSLRDQGKYAEAEPLYRQALDEGSQGGKLPDQHLAEIAERYAVLLEETGRSDEAEALRARWASASKVSDS